MTKIVSTAFLFTLLLASSSGCQRLPPPQSSLPVAREIMCPTPLAASSIAWMPLQQPNTLAGRLVRANGLEPVEGASISLLASKRGVLSGPDGQFRMDSIAARQDTLLVRAIGHISAKTLVRLSDEHGVMAFVVLIPEQVVMDGCNYVVPADRPPSQPDTNPPAV